MTTRFDSKDPGETITAGFDFAALGAPISPEFDIAVWRGTDAAPDAMKVGSPTIAGSWVYQVLTGGVSGVDYTLQCWAMIDGQRRLIDAILPVRGRPAAAD